MFKKLNPYKTGIVLALVFVAGLIPLCVLFFKFFTKYIEFTTLSKAREDFSILTFFTLSLFIIGAVTLYLLAFGRNKYIQRVDTKKNMNGAPPAEKPIRKNEHKHNYQFEQFLDTLKQETTIEELITQLFNVLEAGIGTYYTYKNKKLAISQTFGYILEEDRQKVFEDGETIAFETLHQKRSIVLEEIPDNYYTINSGLGEALPQHIYFVPLKHKRKVYGVLEIGSFAPFSDNIPKFINECLSKVAPEITTT